MRIFFEVLVWIAGIGIVIAILKGFAPVSMLAKIVLSRVGILAIAGICLVFFLRRRMRGLSNTSADK